MSLVAKARTDLVSFARSSVGGYCNADQEFVLAAADEIRLDHSPATGERLGLLVEDQSDNRLSFTDDLTRGNDAESNIDVTKNTIATPANDASDPTADLLGATDTGGTAEVYLDRQFALSGEACCISCFAKAQDSDFIRIGLHDNGGTLVGEAVFNVSTGAVVSDSGVSKSDVEEWGNNWYRCYITSAVLRTATMVARFGLAASDGLSNNVDTTAAAGAYIWGLDVQPNNFLLSHIPSTGDTVGSTTYYYFFDQGLTVPGSENLKAVEPGVSTDLTYYRSEIVDYDPANNLINDVEPIGGPLANKVRFSEILDVDIFGDPLGTNIIQDNATLTAGFTDPGGDSTAWLVSDSAPNPTQNPLNTIEPRKQFTAVDHQGEVDTGAGFAHGSVYVKQGTSPCAVVEFTSFTSTVLVVDFTAVDPTIVLAYPGSGSGDWAVGDGSFVWGARSGTYGGLALDPIDAANFQITDEGGGWYRVQMLAECALGGALVVGPSDGVYYALSRRWTEVIGDGTSGVYVWGGQIASVPNTPGTRPVTKAYTPTPILVRQPGEVIASSPTTRERDEAVMIDTGWMHDNVDYTIAVKATIKDIDGTTFNLFDYYQAAEANEYTRAVYSVNAAAVERNTLADTMADIDLPVTIPGSGTINVAVRSSAPDVSLTWLGVVNDETPVAGDLTSGSIGDTLALANEGFYGWIESVTYYPCSAEADYVAGETATGA